MNEQARLKAFPLAEKELSAFMLSVQRSSGAKATEHAAECWIEALEQFDAAADLPFDWRKITIAAASRLASETILHLACRTQGAGCHQLNR